MIFSSRHIGQHIDFRSWHEAYGTYEEDRIVYKVNDVEYVTNSLERPTFFTAYKLIDEKPLRVGTLSLSSGMKHQGKQYLRIDSIDVHRQHRKEKIAHRLYLAALKVLKDAGYGGLMSRDEDVAAKKFVDRTRGRLGAYNPDPDNPGLWLMDAR